MILPARLGRFNVLRLTERWIENDPEFPGFRGALFRLDCRDDAGQKYSIRQRITAWNLVLSNFDVASAVRRRMFAEMERA